MLIPPLVMLVSLVLCLYTILQTVFCATAKEVKAYVKSVFGATSPQYKQISGLEFKSIK